MRPPRRLFAGLAAALTLCVVATGCDSSPFAASVNGQVIKETALNRQLELLTANKTFIADTIEAAAPNGEGLKVTGQAGGSYTAAWSASVLTAMVTAEVVHQHLVGTHGLPNAAQLAMARAVDSADYSSDLAWYRFTPEVRSTLAQRDAELARVVPADTKITTSQYKGLYDGTLQTSLFTNVCVRDVDVGVTGAGGGIDYPASLTKAKALVSAIDAAGVSGAGKQSFGGSVTCYSHAAFEQQSLGLIGTVLGIKAGQAAAPKKSQDGYEVFAVTKRVLVPYGPSFIKAVSALVQVDSINSGGSTLPAIAALMAKAHVKVDPSYGTWRKTKSGYEVVPPAGPAAHAATVAGAV